MHCENQGRQQTSDHDQVGQQQDELYDDDDAGMKLSGKEVSCIVVARADALDGQRHTIDGEQDDCRTGQGDSHHGEVKEQHHERDWRDQKQPESRLDAAEIPVPVQALEHVYHAVTEGQEDAGKAEQGNDNEGHHCHEQNGVCDGLKKDGGGIELAYRLELVPQMLVQKMAFEELGVGVPVQLAKE